MKIQTKIILWVIAFLLVGLAWGFGLFIDLTGDSGLYAAISRQMVESGDWLNLTINGEPYDQKPHLLFWLAGLGIELFGNNNFAFKLFPFLFALSSLYFIYRLGSLLFSRESGMVAALIAGTSQMFFLYLLDIHTDTILQAGVSLALWQLISYLKKKNKSNFIFGFIGIGLAMLAKGPVGAVLPFFTVLLYLLIKKDFRQLIHPKWILGILIVLAVISPTLWHLYQRFGWDGIRFYFITNNLGRVTGEYVGSSTDPFFYLYNMLWAFLPWTLWIVAALFFELKSWLYPAKFNVARASLLGSVLVLLAVYSIARGKAPNYFMIMVPPLAVVAGGHLSIFKNLMLQRHAKRMFCFQGGILTIMFLLFAAIAWFFAEKVSWLFLGLLAVLSVSAWFYLKIETDSWKRMLFFSVIISGVLNLYLNAQFISGLFQYQGASQALEVFEENRKPDEDIYNLHHHEYELFFYAPDSVIQVHNNDDYREMVKKNNIWIYTTEAGYKGILNNVEEADTVFHIKYRNMNELNLPFLNRKTRDESLKTNYLLKLK
ncbi:MAG: ArnT family glycosyltransferase [Bacteroidota bacterium]